MRKIVTLGFALGLTLALVAPAGAITDGVPDEEEHPMVGQLLFFVPGDGWFNCSGTRLTETVVLTAGHCTSGIGSSGADVWVTFEEDADYFGFPSGDDARRDWANDHADWHRGIATAHPDYTDEAFVFADVGVVELDNPIAGQTATLATEGHLEQFATKRGSQQRFTAVGYGLESGFPRFSGGDSRLQAEMKLVSLRGAYGLKGVSVTFSSNPGQGKGGTCFGDSGGPVFGAGTNTIVAVTSFGVTFNCVEPGGYYRVDTESAQHFILSFLP